MVKTWTGSPQAARSGWWRPPDHHPTGSARLPPVLSLAAFVTIADDLLARLKLERSLPILPGKHFPRSRSDGFMEASTRAER